ncbi:acetyl-CoA carboxylase, carboxyltransferase subunit beta [Exiguobacterium flavidum]|uniref:acetyl-CoA carboxylase, carboxyltransferase subunit beta n=1 Tax=Exiguobacterium flavidum TaxID=2184695 RepID=UPI000DF7A3F1|nr:acetyl-CoA carboxylase, carboxyltransferase subunit beta [Exiguobacterium flavidum]
MTTGGDDVQAFFRKPKKFVTLTSKEQRVDVPVGLMTKCPKCTLIQYTKQLEANLRVCTCGYHHPLTAAERFRQLFDAGSVELFELPEVKIDPLSFKDYPEKLRGDEARTGLREAIVCGVGKVNGYPLVACVMDARFRMGSMGAAVGTAIAEAVRYATKNGLPVTIFSASGGARMQEGMVSLMQMAKTSLFLKQHAEAGLLYISCMTHPTTGGVSASFAMLGDVNIAEPGALIGFAGRRIIEQTIREKLPEDFQTAEFLLKTGQLDEVVSRRDLKNYYTRLLRIHGEGTNHATI